MSRTELKNKNYSKELAAFIRSGLSKEELRKRLSNYHENDIADALERLTAAERKRLYQILGVQRIAEILSYVDDPEIYFKELTIANAAKVISLMDSDDAVDVLENLEEDRKREIVKRLDKEAGEDIRMLLSYDEEEIGSCMTTNYVCIRKDLSIRQAMSELVRQAGENDNISTIYVVDEQEHFLMSKEELENKIATFTGGRAAEELIFHSITTGASNDIEQATKIARAMISRYGMSDDFDMVAMENVSNQYLGGDASLTCSFETQTLLDKKVVELVRREHEKATKILADNIGKLHEIAKYLYEHETITGEEFMKILNEKPDETEAIQDNETRQ